MSIKPNSHIFKLSQDHHLEITFCERIEKGIELDISLDRIKNYVAYFWEKHLQKHFTEEEQLLFKNANDVFCSKGNQDHHSITAEVINITTERVVGQHYFLNLVSSIHQHINFEERVLFPHLELLLSEESLTMAEESLAESHLETFVDDFNDPFWLQSR